MAVDAENSARYVRNGFKYSLMKFHLNKETLRTSITRRWLVKRVFPLSMANNSHSSPTASDIQFFYQVLCQGNDGARKKVFRNRTDHELEQILSVIYEELLWKNVVENDKICTVIQQELIKLRFWGTTFTSTKDYRALYINDRIRCFVDNVNEIHTTKCETLFKYICKFTARSIFVLKYLFESKSEFKKLPWDEIEFLLLHYLKGQDQSYILSKETLFTYLKKFSANFNLQTANVAINTSHQDAVTTKMINDFTLLQDVHSLKKMLYYLNAAAKMNNACDQAGLLLLRTLQVVGEYLKNTAETSHLSNKMKICLMASFPQSLDQSFYVLRNEILKGFFTLPKKIKVCKLQDDLKIFITRVEYLLFQAEVSLMQVVVSRIEECGDTEEQVNYYHQIMPNATDMVCRRINHAKRPELFDLVDKLLKSQELKKIPQYDLHCREVEKMKNKLKMWVHTQNADRLPKASCILKEQLKSNADNIISKMKEFDTQFEPLYEKLQALYDQLKKSDRHRAQLLFSSLNTFFAAFTEIKTDSLKNVEVEMKKKHERMIKKFIKKSLFRGVYRKLPGYRDALANTKLAFIRDMPNLVRIFTQNRKNQVTNWTGLDSFKSSLLLVMKNTTFKKLENSVKNYGKVGQWEKCIDFLKRFLRKYKTLRESVGSFLLHGNSDDVKTAFKALFEANGDLQERVEGTGVVDSATKGVFMKNLSSTLEILKILLQNQNHLDTQQEVILEKSVGDVLQCCQNAGLLQRDPLAAACAFDRLSFTLQGKELRNYLAHGNTIHDILLTKPFESIIMNGQMLSTEEKTIKTILAPRAAPLKVIGVGILQEFREVDDKIRGWITVQEGLFQAAWDGTVEKMKRFLSDGAEFMGRCSKNWNVLHYASAGDNQKVVAWLRSEEDFPYQKSMMYRNSEVQTPIELAAASGSTCVLEDCIEHDHFYFSEDKDERDNQVLNLLEMWRVMWIKKSELNE